MPEPKKNNRPQPPYSCVSDASARRQEFTPEGADKYDRKYLIDPGYAVREIAGEYIAVPVEVSSAAPPQTVLLNETGYFLWTLLQQETTYKNLIHRMTDEFEVSADEAEKDIDEFLSCLEKYNLLETRTEGTK